MACLQTWADMHSSCMPVVVKVLKFTRFSCSLLPEYEVDSIHGSSELLKDVDEDLEVPRRPMTRSQTRKLQDMLNGLQSTIQKCLMMEEELQPNSDFFLKSYTYLEAQIKVQSEME